MKYILTSIKLYQYKIREKNTYFKEIFKQIN